MQQMMQQNASKCITQLRNNASTANDEINDGYQKVDFSRSSDFSSLAADDNFLQFVDNLVMFLNDQPTYHRLVKQWRPISENLTEKSPKNRNSHPGGNGNTIYGFASSNALRNYASRNSRRNMSAENRGNQQFVKNPKKVQFHSSVDKESYADKLKINLVDQSSEKRDNPTQKASSRSENPYIIGNRDENGLSLLISNLKSSFSKITESMKEIGDRVETALSKIVNDKSTDDQSKTAGNPTQSNENPEIPDENSTVEEKKKNVETNRTKIDPKRKENLSPNNNKLQKQKKNQNQSKSIGKSINKNKSIEIGSKNSEENRPEESPTDPAATAVANGDDPDSAE